jgi:cobalt/nickel transport system ATP-binding protein
MIRLRDVAFSYDGTEALGGVDLTIPEGESVAFIGPNGSGKSTLFKLINGIVFAARGSYLFDSEEITAERLKERSFSKRFHQRIGFLFQNPDAQLFCPSVEEEVAFGPRQMGLAEAQTRARVRDCMELLGIDGLASRPPHCLSEGEKRKVALASVLALNPEVLVLDEPMNGLDPRTKSFLHGLIASLHRAGKTILCATHDFAYVEGLFRKAVVLSAEHRVVRTGGFEEIASDAVFLKENNIL